MNEEIMQIDVRKVLAQKAPSVAKKIPNCVVNYLIHTIHQDELNEILMRYHDKDGVDFMESLVTYFDLKLVLKGEHHLVADGRYIFASNHPLGGLDGICLSAVIGKHFGGHIRYLVNDLLMYLPNLKSIFVPVNKHGAQDRSSAQLMEQAYASDNQIVTFPAGLCSRRHHGVVKDLEWKKSFIQKAVEYQRDVVPVYFEGINSNFFYRFANIRKALGIKMNYEMIYLPDEMFRNKHKSFHIYFGEPVPWCTFDESKKPLEWAEWIKAKVYNLKEQ
mgnify:CR=1 FL=1